MMFGRRKKRGVVLVQKLYRGPDGFVIAFETEEQARRTPEGCTEIQRKTLRFLADGRMVEG